MPGMVPPEAESLPPAGPHTRKQKMQEHGGMGAGQTPPSQKEEIVRKTGTRAQSESETHQGRLRSASGPETSSPTLSPAPKASSTEWGTGCRDRGQKQRDAWDADMDQTVRDADFVRGHGGGNEGSWSGQDQEIFWGRSRLDVATY